MPALDPYRVRVVGAAAAATPVIMTPMTFDQAAADLNNKMAGLLTQGDSWMASSVTGNWASAVQSYQAAGAAGVAQIGPEIDASGNPNATQPFTQKAWTLNAALAAVNSTSTAAQPDALLAQGYAHQMYDLYQQALAVGMGTAGQPSWGNVLAWGLGLGLLGGVGVFLYDTQGRHARARKGRRRR